MVNLASLSHLTNYGSLFICATPIGNLGDISYRLVETLKSCDYIFCEDKRRTAKLLQYININKPLYNYNEQANQKTRNYIISLLKNNKTIALLSDAGTPCINDPGVKLVKECRDNNLCVYAIPGANAAITALSISGIGGSSFTYLGFMPTKHKETFIKKLLLIEHCVIFYDTAKRIKNTITLFNKLKPNKKIIILREITKLHEEFISGTSQQLLPLVDNLKGEIVVLTEPCKKIEPDQNTITAKVKEHMLTNSLKEAANLTACELHINKRLCYQIALKIKSTHE